MIVVLYEPIGAFYGSSVAAPVFKKIANKTMAFDMNYVKAINDISLDTQMVAKAPPRPSP